MTQEKSYKVKDGEWLTDNETDYNTRQILAKDPKVNLLDYASHESANIGKVDDGATRVVKIQATSQDRLAEAMELAIEVYTQRQFERSKKHLRSEEPPSFVVEVNPVDARELYANKDFRERNNHWFAVKADIDFSEEELSTNLKQRLEKDKENKRALNEAIAETTLAALEAMEVPVDSPDYGELSQAISEQLKNNDDGDIKIVTKAALQAMGISIESTNDQLYQDISEQVKNARTYPSYRPSLNMECVDSLGTNRKKLIEDQMNDKFRVNVRDRSPTDPCQQKGNAKCALYAGVNELKMLTGQEISTRQEMNQELDLYVRKCNDNLEKKHKEDIEKKTPHKTPHNSETKSDNVPQDIKDLTKKDDNGEVEPFSAEELKKLSEKLSDLQVEQDGKVITYPFDVVDTILTRFKKTLDGFDLSSGTGLILFLCGAVKNSLFMIKDLGMVTVAFTQQADELDAKIIETENAIEDAKAQNREHDSQSRREKSEGTGGLYGEDAEEAKAIRNNMKSSGVSFNPETEHDTPEKPSHQSALKSKQSENSRNQ